MSPTFIVSSSSLSASYSNVTLAFSTCFDDEDMSVRVQEGREGKWGEGEGEGGRG